MEVESSIKLEEVRPKLEEAFEMGCNVEEACLHANISKQSYYNWIQSFPDVKERFDELKRRPFLKARKTIFDNLSEKETAKWYLERRDKDFKSKSDITSDDKPISIYGGLSISTDNSSPEDISTKEKD